MNIYDRTEMKENVNCQVSYHSQSYSGINAHTGERRNNLSPILNAILGIFKQLPFMTINYN